MTETETSTPSSRRTWVAPLVIFLLALAFRGAYVAEIRSLPDFEAPLVDAGYHDYWAWGMASGEWELPPGTIDPRIDSTPYFRPPLPAFWLATIFAVFGHDHLAARVVQALLGSLACVLVFLVAARLFDFSTAVIAGLLAATYWSLVYFDTEYREVVLLVPLYLALVLALLRYRDAPSLARAAVAGLLLGLATLAKPNGLLLLPVLAAWATRTTWARLPGKRHALYVGCFAATTLLCVLPVTVRNAVQGDDFVLVSSNGGINLFIGNNPTSNGVAVCLPASIPAFDSAFDYAEIVRAIEAEEGRPMKHSEVSRWFVGQAFEHITASPGRVLALCAKKALAFWAAVEIVSEKDLVASRRESRILNVVPLDFALVFATGLFGLVLALGAGRGRAGEGVDRSGVVLVVLLVATYAISFVPFFVTARYRAPILPFLLLFSAFAIHRAIGAARGRRWGALTIGVVATAFLYLVDGIDVQGYTRDESKSLVERGAQLAVQGRAEEAERAFRAALAANPDDPRALNNLGLHFQQQGRAAEAVVVLRKAAAIEARDHRVQQNLGLALLDTGESQAAAQCFQRAQELQPLDASLSRAAGAAFLAHKQLGPARAFLERSLALDADSLETRMALGGTFLEAGDGAGAESHLRRATQLDPDSSAAANLLGIALIRQRKIAAAIRSFTEAVRLAPDDPGILDNLNRARAMR